MKQELKKCWKFYKYICSQDQGNTHRYYVAYLHDKIRILKRYTK